MESAITEPLPDAAPFLACRQLITHVNLFRVLSVMAAICHFGASFGCQSSFAQSAGTQEVERDCGIIRQMLDVDDGRANDKIY